MQCPDCKQEIGRSAYCGCGWKKMVSRLVAETLPVKCAHENCGIDALCRIRTKTGWANLCWQHYDQHFMDQVVDNLDKYGLERQPDETRKEHVLRMRRFVKEGAKSFAGGRQAALDAELKRQQDALLRDFSSDLGGQA